MTYLSPNSLAWGWGTTEKYKKTKGSVGAAKALLDAERSFARHESAAAVAWCGWGDAAIINGGDVNNDASPLHLAAAISHKEMVSATGSRCDQG